MTQQSNLAEWTESLANKIAQTPEALLYRTGHEVYFRDPGNKHGPELEKLSDALLEVGGWGHKLSGDYVEKALLEVLLELVDPAQSTGALPLLDRLCGAFDGYDARRTVYIALSGVEMTDVDEVRFGDVLLKKMTEAQKEELAKDFETEEDRNRFFSRVRTVPFIQVTVAAEPIKAWEIARDRTDGVLDLLRYSVPFLSPEDPDPDIDMLGRNKNSPPLVAVHGAKVEDLFESRRERPTDLKLSQRAVEEMKDAGVFEAAVFMVKEPKTDFERKVLRSIQWASNSQAQREPENRLLSLVISLESLLPPPRRTSGGTGAWTAEGTAILLGADLTSRIGIRDRILGLYRKRNSIVHGGEDEEITTEDFIRLRGTVHDLIKTIIEKRDQFEAPDGAYTVARYLQDYKLAPKRT